MRAQFPDQAGQACGAQSATVPGGHLRMVPDLLLPLLLPSVLILLLLLGCAVGQAQTSSQTTTQTSSAATPTDASTKSTSKRTLLSSSNVATSSLASYLARVRAETTSALPTQGAIWTDTGRLTRMTTDVRAMRPNDLISVVVEESLAATTTGKVNNSRASAANDSLRGNSAAS